MKAVSVNHAARPERMPHLQDFHVADHTSLDFAERPSMRTVCLLHGIPPGLSVAIDPSPLAICGAA